MVRGDLFPGYCFRYATPENQIGNSTSGCFLDREFRNRFYMFRRTSFGNKLFFFPER